MGITRVGAMESSAYHLAEARDLRNLAREASPVLARVYRGHWVRLARRAVHSSLYWRETVLSGRLPG